MVANTHFYPCQTAGRSGDGTATYGFGSVLWKSAFAKGSKWSSGYLAQDYADKAAVGRS